MPERRPLPTTAEVAIGALLHDIGKFMQRAIGDVDALPETVRNRISDVLPVFDGRHSHWHALFSDAFFEQCVDPNPLPAPLDRRWIRDCAVYHHRPLNDGVAVPNGAITHLVTQADRIAAAMERKKRDAEQEASPEPATRLKYRKTRLISVLTTVRLPKRPDTGRRYYPIGELRPDTLFDLRSEPLGDDAMEQYRGAWAEFRTAYEALARRTQDSVDGYVEGLLALSERFCWSVPSSTIDDPDVSLHDHGRVAAAVAACLHQHHEHAGDLKSEAAVKDRMRAKFRLVAGDLSGIQASLFRLQSEGVKGLARLLRGRSFRMQLITDVAARLTLTAFGLPACNVIQLAGGRFLILVPETEPGAAQRTVDRLRQDIDDWMLRDYVGDLVFNLGLTRALSANDLMPDGLEAVYDDLRRTAENAKLHPLATQDLGVVALPFDPELAICTACGVRPAVHIGDLDGRPRCPACHAETEIGRALAKAEAVVIDPGATGHVTDRILGVGVTLLTDRDHPAPTGYRLRGTAAAAGRPAADRFFEAYVPRHTAETLKDADLGQARREAGDDDEPGAGDLLTFAELAALSREQIDGDRVGRPMLALLKADVDNLGQVFSAGLGDRRSLSRTAALSRLMDAFFTGWLPDYLRREFPNIYTVYAGGDDLMLLGPWFDVLRFAEKLRAEFGRFAGGNPSLSLSAGVALFDPRTPISLAAAQAEARLEAAKHFNGDKDRISAIGAAEDPLTWLDWSRTLEEAEELNRLVREKKVSTSLLYRLLALDDRRRRAAADPRCADWRAKLGYTLFRTLPKGGARDDNQTVRDRLMRLMGLDPKLGDDERRPYARIALTIALYRNR